MFFLSGFYSVPFPPPSTGFLPARGNEGKNVKRVETDEFSFSLEAGVCFFYTGLGKSGGTSARSPVQPLDLLHFNVQNQLAAVTRGVFSDYHGDAAPQHSLCRTLCTQGCCTSSIRQSKRVQLTIVFDPSELR